MDRDRGRAREFHRHRHCCLSTVDCRLPTTSMGDLGPRADRFWAAEDPLRAEARSRQRADLALHLLKRASISGGRLLDVGCGPGWALARLREAGFAGEG